MEENEQEDTGACFSLQSVLQIIRAAGAILGMIAIITGLVYVTRIFTAILGILHTPEVFEAHLAKWIKAVGGEQLDVVVAGTTFHCANFTAITVLGGGVIILAWLAVALVLAGAKTIAWTLGDREAIKKILATAFGPEKKSNGHLRVQ